MSCISSITGNIPQGFSLPVQIKFFLSWGKFSLGIPGAKEGKNSEYGTVYITGHRPEFSTCFFVLAFQLPLPYTEPMSKPYKTSDKPELMELIEKDVPLGDIDTSLITDMSNLFEFSERKDFSGIEEWDTSRVTDMSHMFRMARFFNHDISRWDVSHVTDMSYMFCEAAAFNQPLESWDVSRVKDMHCLFAHAKRFNRPLENWDVSKVTDMSRMFQNTLCFNQPLEKWDISSVINMGSMFNTARDFNQPLEKWDVSRVTNMVEMFAVIDTFPGGGRQAFNWPLTGWKLRTQDTYHMFYYSSYSHLETLIMAAASSGTDYAPAGYRANVKEQLKNLCGRFGKETVRSALIEYRDKYATGTLLNVLEEME